MSDPSQAFCLLLEAETSTDLPTQTSPEDRQFFELSFCERFANRDGKLSRPENGDPSILLETIRTKTQKCLLMALESGMRVSVNGVQAPCLHVLQPGDALGFDDHVVHVSLLNRPYCGPPAERHLTAKCGYCRGPIQAEAGMHIYACPNCGLPTHDYGEEISAEKRLECVKLASQCGHCQAAIVESEGFTHVPLL